MHSVTDTKFAQLSIWTRAHNKFKRIDLFGRNVGFTYEYNETFKTLEGAILTILILMAMLAVSLIYFFNVIYRTE